MSTLLRKRAKSGKKTPLKIAEEQVRLDFLVLKKCISHMHQSISGDFGLQTVGRQFSTAMKSVHGKMPISVKIEGTGDLDYLYSLHMKLRKTPKIRNFQITNTSSIFVSVHPDRKWEKKTTNGIVSGSMNLIFDRFRSKLAKLFDRFKRVKILSICNLSKAAHEILTNAVRQSDKVHFHRFYAKKGKEFVLGDELLSNFRDTYQLLLCFTTHIKELQLEGEFAIGQSHSEQFWSVIANCSRLRLLNIDYHISTALDKSDGGAYVKNHVLDCLRTLKIKRLHVEECNSAIFSTGKLFDSAETMLSALQENSHLKYLWSTKPPIFFTSSLLRPILSRLRCLNIETAIDESYIDESVLKSSILSILQALPHNGSLFIRLYMVCIDEDYSGDEIMKAFRLFLALSDTTNRSIEISCNHDRLGRRILPSAEVMVELIEYEFNTDEYKDLSVVECTSGLCVVKMNNALIRISNLGY